MEMMYTDISKALKAKNIDANPKDYLSFFCLGNREVKVPGEYEPKRHPTPGTDYDRAQKARRSMIYVHSKLMIGMPNHIYIFTPTLLHQIQKKNSFGLLSVTTNYAIGLIIVWFKLLFF
jgi:hypothetical protein